MNNTIILYTFLSIFISINCFLIGYIVGSKNSVFNYSNEYNAKFKKTNQQSKHNVVNIDESKVVVDITTDNLEKKYSELGDIKKSSENITLSIDKLKNLKK